MLHWKELRPCISLIPQEAVPRELFLQKSKEDDTNIIKPKLHRTCMAKHLSRSKEG